MPLEEIAAQLVESNNQLRVSNESLAQAISQLTQAFSETRGAAPNGAITAEQPRRGPGRPRQPDVNEVLAIAKKLAEAKTPAVAVKLINDHGADKVANMPKDKYNSFIEAAQLLINSAPEQVEL